MIWHALATYLAGPEKRTALVVKEDEAYRMLDLEAVFLAADAAVPTWVTDGVGDALGNWAVASEQLSNALSATDLASIEAIDSPVAAPFIPPRIFAAASNYIEHANEMGTVLAQKAESNPYMFIKASTAVVGPGEAVRIPAVSEKVDWEVELAAVIGCSARRVSVEDALECVAGYTILNDVSARDMTRRSDFPFKFDWFQGKSFDTFAPLGPWIVPAALIDDPQALGLGLDVNGESMQDGTTAEMIFNLREQIAYLSGILTLQPGDVIATGTPTGVGAGRGIFLKPGDVMRAWVEGIGELENPVVADD